MNLKTEIKLPNYPFELSHEDNVISFGSCFSENIGQKLQVNKFDICINPFGILFNPISISKAIDDCLKNKRYTEDDLYNNGEINFSFNHHSKFAGLDKNLILDTINKNISEANEYLNQANVLIITLGSSWVYRLKETNEIVANCYKLSQDKFSKELLTVDEITSNLKEITEAIRLVNPNIQIITTISPVRHWKDGVVENQQSKATLHLALKELNESKENCHYFPSYEIMMDELRDYRYYAKDMLHPSDTAIDYIWEKFSDSFFSKQTQGINLRVKQITQSVYHKPFNSESDNHKKFKENLSIKINEFEKEYPILDFTKEKGVLEGKKK